MIHVYQAAKPSLSMSFRTLPARSWLHQHYQLSTQLGHHLVCNGEGIRMPQFSASSDPGALVAT